MKINDKKSGFLLAGLLLLPGCMSVPTYQRRSLNVFKNGCTYKYTEEGITVCVKQLDGPEKSYLLNGRLKADCDDIELLYFSIHNLNSRKYSIVPEEIGLRQITSQEVAKALKKTNSVARLSGAAVTAGAAAAPFIALAMVTPPPPGDSIILLPYVFASWIISPLLIPVGLIFLAYGIKSIVMNSRISHDLTNKIMHKKTIIKSGGMYEGIICVKSSDYKEQFAMVMHEKRRPHNTIVFNIDLSHDV